VIGELAAGGRLLKAPDPPADPALVLYWLVQSAGDVPEREAGETPAGVLSVVEQAAYANLRSEKRRHDWLLGRWTAKLLLQAVIAEQSGWTAPLERLVIGVEPGGRPYLAMQGWPVIWQRSLLNLSISHSSNRALCAAVSGTGWQVGADLEKLEPRSAGFVADYFNPAEQALCAALPTGERNGMVNVIWSGKEAALKALGVGLRLDTRDVLCLPQQGAADTAGWRPMRLVVQTRAAGDSALPLAGWWRLADGYVYSLALGHSGGRLGEQEWRPGSG
jgi:4'-phosphopantetheinyl transferase